MTPETPPRPIRLRFAPSPTGNLHLGGARTALYNWAAARAMGGAFLVRVEDTDRERSTQDSLDKILAGLRWLGLDWDEGPEVGGEHGPYFQSERLDRYRSAVDQLLKSGHAYRCYATTEEIEAGRKALEAAGKKAMYDRRHRDLSPEQCAAFEAEGRQASVRFRMPLEGTYTLPDMVRGGVEVPLSELDDFVLLRADGSPLYNLACVADDADMQISHVVRGEEHLMNGIKQAVLAEALGHTPPLFAHIPLILNQAGKKLSKRDAATDLLDYRDKGYPPEAIFNYIATLGWGFSADQDLFSREEMCERFRIESINKAPAKFDKTKLVWMCGEYVRRTPADGLLDRVAPFLEAEGVVNAETLERDRGRWRNIIGCYQPRFERYTELGVQLGWLLGPDAPPDEHAQKMLAKNPDAGPWLAEVADLLETLSLPPSPPADRAAYDAAVQQPTEGEGVTPPPELVSLESGGEVLTPVGLEAKVKALATANGWKVGKLMAPLRAAITGTNKGPGIWDSAFLVGKEWLVGRLRAVGAAD